MGRDPIVIPHKSIQVGHKPFCRCVTFTCKGCRYKRDCLQLTRKYVCVTIPQSPIWEQIYAQVNKAKQRNKDVYVITNKKLSDEFIWDVSYSPRNTLQLNVALNKDTGEWISPMVHLAERCGICVNVVIHSIIPKVTSEVKLFSILESIRNCTNYRLILHFSAYKVYGNPQNVTRFTVQRTSIPVTDLKFIWDDLWSCSDEYKEHILDLVQFYLGINKMTIVLCGR